MGTTSIEKFLLEQYPNALQNKIIIAGKLLRFKGHASAKSLSKFMVALFNLFKIYLSRVISFKLWAIFFTYKSKHDVTSIYFKNRFFKKLINLKIRDDLRFYNKIKYTNEAKNIR